MSYYTHILAKYDVSDCKTFEDVKSKFPDTRPAFLRKVIYLKGLIITKEGKLEGTSKEIGHVQRTPSISAPTRIGVTSKSVHVGENLLERARKVYGKDPNVSLHLLRSPIGDGNLFQAIKMKAWEYVFPDEWVLRTFQSMKPVLLFLDENDSDFNSYLFEILKTNRDFLPYYVDYVHLKRRQKTFAQTLLSLLFLESKNIQTGKSFAQDVIRVIKKAIGFIDYKSVDGRMYNKTTSLFRVFSAFLSGTEKERAVSIKFLKCMKCDMTSGHLRRFELSRDLKDQKNTARLFSDILTWFVLSEELRHRKFLACTGNVPIDEMKPEYVTDSGLPELFEQISQKPFRQRVKFCLVSEGGVSKEYVESGTYSVWSEHIPNEVFKIVRVPLVSEVANIENLVLSVIKDLVSAGTILSPLTFDLVSKDVLNEFSNIIIEQNNGKVSIIDIANDLSALFGVAIQKYPKALTLNDVHALFDIVHRPVFAKKAVIESSVSTESAQAPRREKNVPIERTKCWSCAELKQRKDGEFTCPKNASLPRVLPYYFGEKCPNYWIRKRSRTTYSGYIEIPVKIEKWKKEELERKHMKTSDVQNSFPISETQIEMQIAGYCEDCSNYEILYYTNGLYLCPTCKKMKTRFL